MKTLLTLGMVILSTFSYAQTKASLSKIQGKETIDLICSIDSAIVKSSNTTGVAILLTNNGYGSAKQPETDEVSHSFIIAASSLDAVPEKHVYRLAEFYGP